MKKLTKTQLAVKFSEILTVNTKDNNDLKLIKERQGNLAGQVQEFLKCGLDRKDLIFAISEALKDAEPLYLDRDHKGSCQKNRRMFIAAWKKTHEGFSLKIAGKVNEPVVTEIKAVKADPYKTYETACKKLADILPPIQAKELEQSIAVAIEADKIKLQEAVKRESEREIEILAKREVIATEQVVAQFQSLGIDKPTTKQVENGVKALLAVNA